MTMSEESETRTLSQRHRDLLRRGDIARGKRPVAGTDTVAPVADRSDKIVADARSGADAAVAAGATPAARGDTLVDGRFRLLARLGSGRLGEIYEARIEAGLYAGIDRHVALQLIDPSIGADPELIDRLRRGYASLRAGPHRNVVRLDEFSHAGKTGFLVMELLEGASLRFVLDEAGQLQPDEAMPIVQSVGNALSYLHGKRIVHGALTPSAVFVEEDYSVKVLDIVPLMQSLAVPDEGEVATPKDDIYRLACLTYELLTGRHPFNYATSAEALRLNLVPEVIAQLPPIQWRALAHGLALDPAHRSSSIASFLQDLGSSDSRSWSDRGPPVAADVNPEADPPIFPIVSDRRVSPSPPPAGGRWARRGFAVVVLGALLAAAWIYRDPIRETAMQELVAVGIDLFADGDDRAASAIAETGAEQVSTAQDGAAQDSIAEDNVAQESSAQDTVEPSADFPPAEPVAESVANPAVDTAAESPNDPAPADASAPASAPNSARDSTASAGPDPAASSESGLTTPESTPAPISETRFIPPAVVRVAEGGSALSITVRREGDTAASATLIWWVRSDTAQPGEDYADLGDQTETFAPGEPTVTILIPIVDDGLPESLEGFIVNVGRTDPDSGSVVLVGMTRVVIEDDDNSRF